MDILTKDDIITARRNVRKLAGEIGFSSTEQAILAAVATELARNIVEHAGRGVLLHEVLESGTRHGIILTARDQGPGIPNITLAIESNYSVAAGLGLGLAGIKGVMDSLEIISVPGKGTTVIARRWSK